MKRALLIGLAAVVLVVALVLALPFLIPLSVYRAQIEQQATKATGRVVKIDGPLRISLFPMLGLRADNTSLASVPGGAHPHLAETESVEVAVALAPLLSEHIEVSQIVLVRPQIHLDVDKAGGANWTLAGLKTSSSPATGPALVHFVDVKVEDGELTYASAKSGSQRSLDHLNADLNMPEGGKLTATGDFDENGKTISFDAAVDNFDAMSAGVESPAHLSFTSDLFQAGFAGKVSRDGEADGDLKFETSSLRDVADLFGHHISSGGGLGHFSLKSQFGAHNKIYALSGITLSLDTIAAKGALSIDTNGALPYAKGALAVDRLDLNPYMGLAGNGGAPEPGWSAKPISLSILRDADADLSLNANALAVKRLKISNAYLTVKLQGGKLDASLDKIELYGGQGQATVTVDSSTPVPTFENHLTFVNIQTGKFLTDTLGVGAILGTGNLRLDVTSRGKSSNDVMHALAGTGAVAIRNGQLRGIDLGAMARTVQTVVGGSAGAINGVTGFSAFGGNFAIKDGVLASNNLTLSGPIITMTGHGAVDLGNRTIDFHLTPKAGIGGDATNAVGVAVPIRVTGTWDQPKYGPDLQGVVNGVINSIEQGGSALKSLFTGGSKSNGQKKNATVGDSVKSLFGIH